MEKAVSIISNSDGMPLFLPIVNFSPCKTVLWPVSSLTAAMWTVEEQALLQISDNVLFWCLTTKIGVPLYCENTEIVLVTKSFQLKFIRQSQKGERRRSGLSKVMVSVRGSISRKTGPRPLVFLGLRK